MGGQYAEKMLAYGEIYDTALDMDDYLVPLKPGRYRVVVQYHNTLCIDERIDTSTLILTESDPFELVVKPVPIGAKRGSGPLMGPYDPDDPFGRDGPLDSDESDNFQF